jgi:hypothetical protein
MSNRTTPGESRAAKLLREPLVHFLLLGAGLFALAELVGGTAAVRPERVSVSTARIEELAQGFERTWSRPPTQAELAGLVEDYVREEVFYREALALGLDRDDVIIRRRLRQKMEFLSDDLAAEPTPGDAELAAYLAEHADEFRVEPRLTFRHVYLSRDRRGERVRADAEEVLARLRKGEGGEDAPAFGDPLPLASRYDDLPAGDVAKLLGAGFAQGVLELEPGGWQGPVESAYGLHLVRVESRAPGRVPELAEVRPAVEREWLAQWRRAAREASWQELRARYEVEIEPPPAAATGG